MFNVYILSDEALRLLQDQVKSEIERRNTPNTSIIDYKYTCSHCGDPSQNSHGMCNACIYLFD